MAFLLSGARRHSTSSATAVIKTGGLERTRVNVEVRAMEQHTETRMPLTDRKRVSTDSTYGFEECTTHRPDKMPRRSEEDEMESTADGVRSSNKLAQVSCEGYVFYMSDGSCFSRSDVERVSMDVSSLDLPAIALQSRLISGPSSVSRRDHGPRSDENGGECVIKRFLEDEKCFDFHICVDDDTVADSTDRSVRSEWSAAAGGFKVSNRCDSWGRLSDTQRQVLNKIQERLELDRAENRYFTCAIIEGPGGCGKTRLMSHVMNHKRTDALVLYVTKQNKRVQDFVHTDCLSGEVDRSVQKPVDMTPLRSDDIRSVFRQKHVVGRFAVTAEKLVYALANLPPRALDTKATTTSLGIDYGVFRPRDVRLTPTRNVVILLDEYTMHQSPLIHALAYHTMRTSRSPLLMIMGGDRLQCGPVGWSDVCRTTNRDDTELYTDDVRHDISTRMMYDPLELKMENLQRCVGDLALGGCVKRLRRVCGDAAETDSHKKKLLHLILARYSVEAGVDLYMQQLQPNGESFMRRIVPMDVRALDFDGSGLVPSPLRTRDAEGDLITVCDVGPAKIPVVDVEAYMSRLEEEEYDESGVAFGLCSEPPLVPMYDMLPLVNHFVALYTTLAEGSFVDARGARDKRADVVHESVMAIRDLFPVFIVLTNNLCNLFAEAFFLALHTQVRERLLNAPLPVGSGERGGQAWRKHLEYTLRQNVRCLSIDEEDSTQRQTLFVGMIYKMTTTFKSDVSGYLCNGETVVLTSIVYGDENAVEHMKAVTLRKLQRDTDTDFTLLTGYNKNRMTNEKRLEVMPFVPYISENIYQMQGNTMPKGATTFVDLVNVPCKSAYVAVSRFQNSGSIKGIVISE